ncbi:MAG: hypothetical protein ABEN55_06750 [Bradymonadaceae bacterium]
MTDQYREWLADSIESSDRLEGYDYEVTVPAGPPLVLVAALDADDPLRQTLWATVGAECREAYVEREAPPKLAGLLADLGLEVVPDLREVAG